MVKGSCFRLTYQPILYQLHSQAIGNEVGPWTECVRAEKPLKRQEQQRDLRGEESTKSGVRALACGQRSEDRIKKKCSGIHRSAVEASDDVKVFGG